MSGPWMKFYPSDWRSDPCLRMCSIGARGLWMEMLCIMHEAVPRGSLVVNGKGLTETQLALLAGISARDAITFLGELEATGVFSRHEDGTIYSRRMERDENKAAEDRTNGKRGGNPNITKGVNPPVNRGVGEGDKAQILEARSQSVETKVSTQRALAEEFENTFWPAYSRKVSKGDARRAFFSARGKVPLATIMDGLGRFNAKGVELKYVPYPGAWLRAEKWADEPEIPSAEVVHAPLHGVSGPAGFYAKMETPQFEAWDEHLRKEGKRAPTDRAGGWWFPSEFPPNLERQAS